MKKRLLALLLVLVCLCLSGCAQLVDGTLALVANKAEETGADRLTRQFVDGVLANDAEASLAAMVPGVTLESLLAVFPKMRTMLPETDSYTLSARSWNTNISNGVSQHTFQFLLTIAEETFVVQTVQVSTMEGLYNINIAPYTPEDTAETADASPASSAVIDIAFLLVSVAEVVFVIWALVDCCRHKIRRKWLLVLVILLGNVLIGFLLTEGKLRLNLNFGLYLTATFLQLYEGGGFAFQLLLPVGALYYLARRKALINAVNSQAFSEAFPAEAQESPTEAPAASADPDE